jgi:hypothetical protein
MPARRSLRNLSLREWRILTSSLVMLPATAIGLRLFSLGRVRGFFERGAAPVAGGGQREPAEQVAHMVAAAAHYSPYKATCLPQSIVLQWQLRRLGIHSELRFGVRGEGGAIEAHSWVEHQGVPLIDSPAVRERFTELRGAR